MQHFGRSRVPNSTSPVLSKLAETRFVQQCQEHRLTKLRAVKASVRSTWEQRPCEPTSRPFYPHLDRNAKRAQLQGERYLAIELENYRLLERMARAMENAPDSVPVAPGVRLSANQLPRMDSYLVESHMPGTARLQPRSRTEGTKRRERERIAAANALLLHRIESARSGSPTRAELSSARREAVGYMNLMRGNFPYPAPAIKGPQSAAQPPPPIPGALRFRHLLPPGARIPLPAIMSPVPSRFGGAASPGAGDGGDVDGVHDTWRAGGDVHDGAQRDEDGARGRGAVQLRLSMQRSEAGDELAADTAVVRVALAPRSTRAPRASAGVLEASPAAAVQPAATAEPAAKSPRPAAAPRGPTLYRTVQPVAPAASQPASSARAAASEDAHAAQPEATVQPEPTANAQSASGERAATMDAQNSQPGASVEAEAALAPGGEVAPLVQLEPPRAEQLDSGSPNPTAQALGAAGDGSR